ncbi:hypothetical protein HH308_06115 [Gordonia sp. TBRC 11910]|uniref:Uncharacterized protein n=1 Tax=Gordonia asplenii TaxID=2725283 RepID=A0A848KZB0_9ACTN|nr:hypothetical protein [Gordonia asplenii]NMO00788.1 hypothetical protein [Gordonia asplenii]
MTETAPIVNWVPTRDFRRACAVCQWCDSRSLPIPVGADGRPFFLGVGGQGWLESPYPISHQHADGSRGSKYTCPACAQLCATT